MPLDSPSPAPAGPALIGLRPAYCAARVADHGRRRTHSAPNWPERRRRSDAQRVAAAALRPRRAAALLLCLLIVGCDAPRGADAALAGLAANDGHSAYGAYLAGRAAAMNGDMNVAGAFFERALHSDPNNPELLDRAFLVVTAEGRVDQSVALARRLAQLDPPNPIALYALGFEGAKGGHYSTAEADLARVPRVGINNLMLPLAQAWLAAGRDDAGAAAAALNPLAEISAFAVLYDVHAGLIAETLADPATARRHFQAILDADPTPSFRVVDLIGGFFERHGQPDQAKALYDAFVGQNPDTTLLAPSYLRLAQATVPPNPIRSVADGLAEAMFDVASIIQHERPGDDQALIDTRFALSLRPDFPMAQMLLADVLDSEGREAEAIVAYRTIAPESPFRWSARLRVAANEDAAGDTPRALNDLSTMAEEEPARIDALAERGDILRNHDRFAEAIQAYDAALSRLPMIERRHWSLLFDRAIALERAGRLDQAEADLKRAIDLQPDEPYLLNFLGYVWVERNRNLPAARAMIQKAVDLRPSDGDIVDSLGWVYFKSGDYTKAVRTLEHASELKPQDATINDHLGDAYWRVGRRDEATVQWRRALSLDADADLRAAITAKLANRGPERGDRSGPDKINGDKIGGDKARLIQKSL